MKQVKNDNSRDQQEKGYYAFDVSCLLGLGQLLNFNPMLYL